MSSYLKSMIYQVLLYVVYQQLIVMSIEKIIGKENGSVKVWSEWKIAAGYDENDLSLGYEKLA